MLYLQEIFGRTIPNRTNNTLPKFGEEWSNFKMTVCGNLTLTVCGNLTPTGNLTRIGAIFFFFLCVILPCYMAVLFGRAIMPCYNTVL